jgi:hypothetical protein
MLYGRRPVSGEELILFAHVPKTGGSSLRRSLAALVGVPARSVKERRWTEQRLADAGETADTRLIAGHFRYGRHRYFSRPALYVTVVRDPVRRFVSWYNYVQALPKHPDYRKTGGRSMEDALAIAIERGLACTHNDQCHRATFRRRFGAARRIIERHYFLAGCTEQLDELNEAIWRAYGPGRPIPSLERRKAGAKRAPEEVSPRVRRMLEQTSPDDFLLYDYVRRRFAEISAEVLPEVRAIGYEAVCAARAREMPRGPAAWFGRLLPDLIRRRSAAEPAHAAELLPPSR